MSVPKFVALCAKTWQPILPQRRTVFEQVFRLRLNKAHGNADIKNLQSAAQSTTRQKQMTGLWRHEGHGVRRLKSGPQHLPGATAQPTRQICRNHRQPQGANFPDNRRNAFGNRPVKPSAEQPVNHDIACARVIVIQRRPSHRTIRTGTCRITPETPLFAETKKNDRSTAFNKRPRRHIAIATIVAGTGQNYETHRFGVTTKSRCCDGPTGLDHQAIAVDSRLRGCPVNGCHGVWG